MSSSAVRESLVEICAVIRQRVQHFHRAFGDDAIELLNGILDDIESALDRPTDT